MMGQNKPDLPMLSFESQESFEGWLEKYHADSVGIWLKLAKKGSNISSVGYDEAVESALCYGWIDSQNASFDNQYWLQKFSPRRTKSKWSQMNCEKAEALIAAGRLQPAGIRQVELAKEDGRWKSAYTSQSRITIPDDFQSQLDSNQKAKDFFSTLNSINRYAILHRIQAAKKPETRAQRINKYIEMLANNEKIYP